MTEQMDKYLAVQIVEGIEAANDFRTREAWQFVIDYGISIREPLQKVANDLLMEGLCEVPRALVN